MPTNQLLPFATGGGANVLSPASYAALAARLTGFTAGVAQSVQLNSAWRQAAFAAAMIGQFTADNSGQDTLDDGDVAKFEQNFTRAVEAAVFATIFATQADTFAGTRLDRAVNPKRLAETILRDNFKFAYATGTPNALAVTLPGLATPFGIASGELNSFMLFATQTNTGAATLSINAGPAIPLVRRGGVAVQPGDIRSGPYLVVREGNNLRVAGALPSDYSRKSMAVYSTPGTFSFTVPDGVYVLRGRVWGAGGGGGGSSGGTFTAGSAGGNGGYGEGVYPVTPLQGLAITVGGGGIGGIGANGTPGGTTSLGALISATGGGLGYAGLGGIQSTLFAPGGNATGGLLNIQGGVGGYGFGAGGTAFGGFAQGDFGRPGGTITSGSDGAAGVFPGGGGTGGSANGRGGNGGNGFVTLEY